MTGRASRFYIKADSNKVYLEHLQIIMNAIDVVDECVAVQRPTDEELFDTKVFVRLKEGIFKKIYEEKFLNFSNVINLRI